MQYLLIITILCSSVMLAYFINIPIKNKQELFSVLDNVFTDYFSYENSVKFPFIYYLKKYNTNVSNVFVKTIILNYNKISLKSTDINELNNLLKYKYVTKPFASEQELKAANIILLIFKYKKSFKIKKDIDALHSQYKELSETLVNEYINSIRINYILTTAIAVVAIILII